MRRLLLIKTLRFHIIFRGNLVNVFRILSRSALACRVQTQRLSEAVHNLNKRIKFSDSIFKVKILNFRFIVKCRNLKEFLLFLCCVVLIHSIDFLFIRIAKEFRHISNHICQIRLEFLL
jgi:hypothetical protein